MAIQIEPVDDEHSRTSAIYLRIGADGVTTCVEIPRAELEDTIRTLFGWLAWTDEKAASSLLKRRLFSKKPIDDAALSARIAALEHALRRASERFGWLGEHHVDSDFAKTACRNLTDEMWAIQCVPSENER